MIEEMKRQINHLIETFDYDNIGDYKDLLYIIYLNWIENNGENEEINELINNFIKTLTLTPPERNEQPENRNDDNRCNSDCSCNQNSYNRSYEIYRYFLGERLSGIPKDIYDY